MSMYDNLPGADTAHKGLIAMTRLKANGCHEPDVSAVMAYVAYLERDIDVRATHAAAAFHRINEVEAAARDVVRYHRSGNFGDRTYDEGWNPRSQSAYIEALAEAVGE